MLTCTHSLTFEVVAWTEKVYLALYMQLTFVVQSCLSNWIYFVITSLTLYLIFSPPNYSSWDLIKQAQWLHHWLKHFERCMVWNWASASHDFAWIVFVSLNHFCSTQPWVLGKDRSQVVVTGVDRRWGFSWRSCHMLSQFVFSSMSKQGTDLVEIWCIFRLSFRMNWTTQMKYTVC